MKKLLRLSCCIAALLLTFTACKKDDADDSNVIVDTDGILIEMTWTNSENPATKGADLDLTLSENAVTLLTSYSSTTFESVQFGNNDLDNGTYTLDVFVADISKVTDYKISCKGRASGKVYAESFGPVRINDIGIELQPLTMVKSGGNKYVFSR